MMKLNKWLPVLLMVLTLIAYQLLYAFKFFPITEGWFSLYAQLIREGNIPYRDFSLLMPPLYPLQIAFIQAIFGEDLWVLRVIGIGVVCGIGFSLWLILSQFFNSWISAFSSLIAVIYYQTGNAFIGYDFTQVLTFNILLGSAFILKEFDFIKAGRKSVLFFSPAFFAGFFLVSAALTKQSNGSLFCAVIFLGYLAAMCLLAPWPVLIMSIFRFGVGCFSIVLPVFLWLYLNSALTEFFNQIFFEALGAKGGGQKIFTGWMHGFFLSEHYFPRALQIGGELVKLLVLIGLPTVIGAALICRLSKSAEIKGTELLFVGRIYELIQKNTFTASVICVFMVVIAIYELSPYKPPTSQNAHEVTLSYLALLSGISIWVSTCILLIIGGAQLISKLINKDIFDILNFWIRNSQIVIGLIGLSLLGLLITLVSIRPNYIIVALLNSGSHIGSGIIFISTNLYVFGSLILGLIFIKYQSFGAGKRWLLMIIGVGLVLGNGTSAGLSEISAFFGLSLVLSSLLTFSAPLLFPAIIPLVLSTQLSYFLIERKLENPYSWWSVKSRDVRVIQCATTSNVLQNLCIEQDKFNSIKHLVDSIQQVSKSSDVLYVFPHAPIFNILSGRLPYGNSVVSWFDFTSQNKAQKIANEISSNPPKLILIARLPKEVFEGHEKLFNNGEPSKQRNIVKAIDQLVNSNKAVMIDSAFIDGLQFELYEIRMN